MTYREFIVPGKNGSRKNRNRYEDREIKVVVEVRGANPLELSVNVRELLMKWVNVKSKLIFSKQPSLFYEAEIFNAVEKVETKQGTIELTIIFNASPFLYELYSYPDALKYGNLTAEEDGVMINKISVDVTTPITKELINRGNHEAIPIIILSGSATNVMLTLGDHAFNYERLSNEEVIIDCEKMIVYTQENEKKKSKLFNFNGTFPKIPTGISNVAIGGIGLDLTVEIKYRNTYIV